MENQIHIIICVEKGILEQQALLFVESVCQLSDKSIQVHAYCPRKNFQPSKTTALKLKSKGLNLIVSNINTKFLNYPVANKLLSTQNFEINNACNKSIIFSDTDTVILNKLQKGIMLNKPALFLRPVDNKGPGSEGKGDANDLFWQQIFSLCEVEMPEPSVWTTVRPHFIRNYFNAGFIWAHRLDGFYQKWFDDFIKIVESDLRPFGWTSRDGDDYRCLDQVALAVTATRFQEFLQILPESYNYPIPFRPMMKDRENHPAFKDLVHVHYHKWFQHPDFLGHVTSEEDKQSEQYKWLKTQLPLSPEIDDDFKC